MIPALDVHFFKNLNYKVITPRNGIAKVRHIDGKANDESALVVTSYRLFLTNKGNSKDISFKT